MSRKTNHKRYIARATAMIMALVMVLLSVPAHALGYEDAHAEAFVMDAAAFYENIFAASGETGPLRVTNIRTSTVEWGGSPGSNAGTGPWAMLYPAPIVYNGATAPYFSSRHSGNGRFGQGTRVAYVDIDLGAPQLVTHLRVVAGGGDGANLPNRIAAYTPLNHTADGWPDGDVVTGFAGYGQSRFPDWGYPLLSNQGVRVPQNAAVPDGPLVPYLPLAYWEQQTINVTSTFPHGQHATQPRGRAAYRTITFAAPVTTRFIRLHVATDFDNHVRIGRLHVYGTALSTAERLPIANVQASSENGAHAASHITDPNMATFWASQTTGSHYVDVDLGSPQIVAWVELDKALNALDNAISHVNVQISPDFGNTLPTNWQNTNQTTAGTITTPGTQALTQTVTARLDTPVVTRYLRVYVDCLTEAAAISLMRIFGEAIPEITVAQPAGAVVTGNQITALMDVGQTYMAIALDLPTGWAWALSATPDFATVITDKQLPLGAESGRGYIRVTLPGGISVDFVFNAALPGQFDENRPNLALRVPTFSSNAADNGQGAVSGNLDSDEPRHIWESGDIATPQYIIVDLGEPRTVREAELYWGALAPAAYQIQGSNDRAAWTNIAEMNRPTPGQVIFPFAAAQTFQYFRVLITQALGENETVVLHGFELFALANPNLAHASRGASAQDYRREAGNPAYAINGNMAFRNDRWSGHAQAANPGIFLLDLGQVRNFRNIVIYWEGFESADYTLWVSDTAGDWNQVNGWQTAQVIHRATPQTTNNGNTSARTSIVFDEPVNGRFIRFIATRGPSSWASTSSFFQFEVYEFPVRFPPRAANVLLWHGLDPNPVEIASSTQVAPHFNFHVANGDFTLTRWVSEAGRFFRDAPTSTNPIPHPDRPQELGYWVGDRQWINVRFSGRMKTVRNLVVHWDTDGALPREISVRGGLPGDHAMNIIGPGSAMGRLIICPEALRENDGILVVDLGGHYNLGQLRIYIDEQEENHIQGVDRPFMGVSIFQIEAFAEEGFIIAHPPRTVLDFLHEIIPEVRDGEIYFPTQGTPLENFTISIFGSCTPQIVQVVEKDVPGFSQPMGVGLVHTPLVDSAVALILHAYPNPGACSDLAPLVALRNVRVWVEGQHRRGPVSELPMVFPTIREWHRTSGYFESASRLMVDANATLPQAEMMWVAETTAADYAYVTGRPMDVVVGTTPAAGDLFLTASNTPHIANLGHEGYELTVTGHIRIEASERIGVFYGTRSVLQILRSDYANDNRFVPQGIARDYPKYEVRGMMLDTARKFFPLHFLEDYMWLLGWYKLNTLHVGLNNDGFPEYFSDDWGWEYVYEAFRLESNVFPTLASDTGHYTQAEFRDLQRLGQQFGVTIIPEFNTPAHALSYTLHIPGLPHYPFYSGGGVNPRHQHLLNQFDFTDERTLDAIRPLFTEFLGGPDPVIMGGRVHIGTDEFRLGQGQNRQNPITPSGQQSILPTGHAGLLGNYFRHWMNNVFDIVRYYGMAPYAWGSLTDKPGSLVVDPTGVTFTMWSGGYQRPDDAVRDGFRMVNTPGHHYIVPEAGYFGNFMNIRNIVAGDEPVRMPGGTLLYGHPYVRGGMFAVWNDIIHNGISAADVHVRAFPMIQAYAQTTWSGHGGNTGVTWPEYVRRADNAAEAPRTNISRQLTRVPDNQVLHLEFRPGAELENSFGFDVGGVSLENVDVVNTLSLSRAARFNGGESFIETDITELGFGRNLYNNQLLGWTMSVDIKPDADNPVNATLFESDLSQLLLHQGVTVSGDNCPSAFDPNFPRPICPTTHVMTPVREPRPVRTCGHDCPYCDTTRLGFNTKLHGDFFVHPNNYHYFDFTVPSGEWTNIVLVGDHNGTSLYVNGTRVQRLQNVGIPRLFNRGERIRYMQTLMMPLHFIGGRDNAFAGYMRNIQVYNRILTSAEVAGLAAESRLNMIELLAAMDYFDALGLVGTTPARAEAGAVFANVQATEQEIAVALANLLKAIYDADPTLRDAMQWLRYLAGHNVPTPNHEGRSIADVIRFLLHAIEPDQPAD